MRPPVVVYHAAAMGDWQEVVSEQLALLAESGLSDVRLSHVGTGLDWIMEEAGQFGLRPRLIRSDPNTDHYETFALVEIERLAKSGELRSPVLYFHTKGVSAPGHEPKRKWRRLMQEHVIRRWRPNMDSLRDHDAAGVNWWGHGDRHFSGNFWMATPEWLRKLPDYVAYHHSRNLTRYSCEMWIGSAPGCRAKSLACSDQPFWHDDYDFDRWLDQAALARLADGITELPSSVALRCRDCLAAEPRQASAPSARTFGTLWEMAAKDRLPKILELGSGASSVLFRSLPHSPSVWTTDDNRDRLANTFLRLASLRLPTDRMFPLDAVRKEAPSDFDLVFVDPPESGPAASLEWAAARVRPGGRLAVNHFHRPSVRDLAANILAGWTVTVVPDVSDVHGRRLALCERQG
ncbi:class I SAM-dependent methyltransferase [Zavarzinella formosa]|uniref:class I SAM-dependent methyltransferase n=1 Tax=Zavarzinella formosa TaxID=360055 RepID=UPI000309DB2B|nr:SAM-dependent methyltransferase [Zavarzinella formosa]